METILYLLGHEIHLAADIRIVSEDVQYARNENKYGRVPGVAPVRMVKEVGYVSLSGSDDFIEGRKA